MQATELAKRLQSITDSITEAVETYGEYEVDATEATGRHVALIIRDEKPASRHLELEIAVTAEAASDQEFADATAQVELLEKLMANFDIIEGGV